MSDLSTKHAAPNVLGWWLQAGAEMVPACAGCSSGMVEWCATDAIPRRCCEPKRSWAQLHYYYSPCNARQVIKGRHSYQTTRTTRSIAYCAWSDTATLWAAKLVAASFSAPMLEWAVGFAAAKHGIMAPWLQAEAAVTLQAAWRGFAARRHVRDRCFECDEEDGESAPMEH